METTTAVCLEEVKKYNWLMLGTSLQQDAVASLIKQYIDTHKWLINEAIPFEVTFEQASYSWYENVYKPIFHALDATGLLEIHQKKGYSLIDSLRAVSDTHYYFNSDLNKGYTSYEDVCYSLVSQVQGFWLIKIASWLSRR